MRKKKSKKGFTLLVLNHKSVVFHIFLSLLNKKKFSQKLLKIRCKFFVLMYIFDHNVRQGYEMYNNKKLSVTSYLTEITAVRNNISVSNCIACISQFLHILKRIVPQKSIKMNLFREFTISCKSILDKTMLIIPSIGLKCQLETYINH